jgi:hypothetical protein
VFYLEGIFRTDADCLADSMAVLRTPLERLKDQQIEGSLKKINTAGGELWFRHGIRLREDSVADSLP